MTMKIAIVQDGPVFLNKEETLLKALSYMDKAANSDIIAFGETWFSGYPAWLDYCPNVGIWDDEKIKEVYARTVANSVSVTGLELDEIRQKAKELNLAVILGINEKVEHGIGNGSLFNSIVTINEFGEIVNHHRKLMPTFTEKLVYSHGDGAGLQSVSIHNQKVGSLICWEHWLPMARQAMHNEGERIHFALWPWVHDRHELACRQYAFEGRCFVIGVGQLMTVAELPESLDIGQLTDTDLLLKGGSCVVKPNGRYLMPPNFTDKFIEIEIDLAETVKEQMTLDVTGNYARWDVFDFSIDKTRK